MRICGAIRYCNKGHILSAIDMHTALKERPIRACTAAVCLVHESKKDLEINKLQQFSAMHCSVCPYMVFPYLE